MVECKLGSLKGLAAAEVLQCEDKTSRRRAENPFVPLNAEAEMKQKAMPRPWELSDANFCRFALFVDE